MTVDKKIAEDIKAGKYPEDKPQRIVEYENAWGGVSYGVTFKGEDPDKYLWETEFVKNPKIWWESKDGYKK